MLQELKAQSPETLLALLEGDLTALASEVAARRAVRFDEVLSRFMEAAFDAILCWEPFEVTLSRHVTLACLHAEVQEVRARDEEIRFEAVSLDQSVGADDSVVRLGDLQPSPFSYGRDPLDCALEREGAQREEALESFASLSVLGRTRLGALLSEADFAALLEVSQVLDQLKCERDEARVSEFEALQSAWCDWDSATGLTAFEALALGRMADLSVQPTPRLRDTSRRARAGARKPLSFVDYVPDPRASEVGYSGPGYLEVNPAVHFGLASALRSLKLDSVPDDSEARSSIFAAV